MYGALHHEILSVEDNALRARFDHRVRLIFLGITIFIHSPLKQFLTCSLNFCGWESDFGVGAA